MKIILLERVDKLGFMGDLVEVKTGYARNYLLPQKKALRASEENVKAFEAKRKEYEATNIARKSDAEKLAAKMSDISVTLIRQAAETGQLYGSVTGRDVAAAIIEAGYQIERRQVVLDVPFKNIGVYRVDVSLHPDVAVKVKVTVARSAEDALKAELNDQQQQTADADMAAVQEAAGTDEQPKQKPRARKAKKEDVE